MTVRDLLRKSLLLIGAISSVDTISADEAADGLISINDLLESWSTEGLMLQHIKRESFNLVVNQAAYNMGTGGDFNSARPALIEEIKVSKDSVEYHVDILNAQQWAEVAQKTLTITIPQFCYIEETPTYQIINLYPKPSEANQLIVYSKKPLTAFASLSTTVDLQLGAAHSLRFNLAVLLAPEYGKNPSEIVMMEASRSKQLLMRKNITKSLMSSDYTNGASTFNPYTGE